MLVFLPTPIGNLEDMSLRALRALNECDTILCEDTRVAASLLLLLQKRALLQKRHVRLVSVHAHNEEDFVRNLAPDFFAQNVVYLSDAGLPCVSDPGAALVRYAQQNGIAYTVLPGANAALCAFVASGMGSKEFHFYGFLPHKRQQKEQELAKLLATGGVVVCYESPHRLIQTLEILVSLGIDDVFAAKEMSKQFESYYRASPAALLAQIKQPRGEWTLVLNLKKSAQKEWNLSEFQDLLPPKVLAKVQARMSGRSVRECYDSLREEESR